MRLHLSHILFIILLALGVAFPNRTAETLLALTHNFSSQFGWAVLLICTSMVGLAIYLVLSRYGNMRLGPTNSRPAFSYASWTAMLFAAGMGTGLVFYGAAEPLLHMLTPPPGNDTPESFAGSARYAMSVTYFHWGIHAWAVYAMAGLAVGYYTYCKNRPALPSSSCIPSETTRATRTLGHIINSFAILAIAFGLVASIGQGVLVVSQGLHEQLDITNNDTLRICIIAVMAVCYTLSASTGIKRGIRVLSNINMLIAIGIMLFVLFAGPTLKLMQIFFSGVGDYVSQFVTLSFDTRPYATDKDWISTWSVQYFLWWVAWAPFVGVFIARISRGRTIREFLLGVILVPSIASAFWFAIFGGATLDLFSQSPELFVDATRRAQGVIFTLLSTLPYADITYWTTMVLVFIFLITSADSGMYILGMFSADGALHPSLWQKIFWGSIIAALSIFATSTGRSTDFFRAFAVTGSIPFLVIMAVQLRYTIRQIHRDYDSSIHATS